MVPRESKDSLTTGANAPEDLAGDRLVEVAMRIAQSAHANQVDKAGRPYVDHPRRVAERLADAGAPAETIAAGWLHDVLEDTEVTADELREAGVPVATIAVVEAVTTRTQESAQSYAARIVETPLALDVKRADLADNRDPGRLSVLDQATRDRLVRKYDHMTALLDDAVATDRES